jgi:hypothetical protein
MGGNASVLQQHGPQFARGENLLYLFRQTGHFNHSQLASRHEMGTDVHAPCADNLRVTKKFHSDMGWNGRHQPRVRPVSVKSSNDDFCIVSIKAA